MSLYTGLLEDPSGSQLDLQITFPLSEILAEFPQDTATMNTPGDVVCLESLDRPYSLPVCSTPLVAWTAPAFDGEVYSPVATPEPGLAVLLLGALFVIVVARKWWRL
jgi:hypothetical protein